MRCHLHQRWYIGTAQGDHRKERQHFLVQRNRQLLRQNMLTPRVGMVKGKKDRVGMVKGKKDRVGKGKKDRVEKDRQVVAP
jgi:hypothetical protein